MNPAVRAAVAQAIVSKIPPGAKSVLDLGCGDGKFGEFVARCRPGTTVVAADLQAPASLSPLPFFACGDGELPFESGAFDVVVLFNVLHHAKRPADLLREALRVARNRVVVKDHVASGWPSLAALTVLDWIGNVPQGRSPRARYFSRADWSGLLAGRSYVETFPVISGSRLYDRLFSRMNVVYVIEA